MTIPAPKSAFVTSATSLVLLLSFRFSTDFARQIPRGGASASNNRLIKWKNLKRSLDMKLIQTRATCVAQLTAVADCIGYGRVLTNLAYRAELSAQMRDLSAL